MSTPDTKLTAHTNPELVSTDSSMTFHTANREVLRITNEARLIIGEGLSKDEATQEVAKLLVAAFDEQIQKMLDKRIASIKSELDRMNHNDTIATEDYLNYGPRNTTPRTDFIAHKGYTERAYICEMTELARILETELAATKSELEKIVLIAGLKADSNVELRMRAEKAEAESNKLLEHGIQAIMIARSWAIVWRDKLSPDSFDLFTEYEQAFLSVKEAKNESI